MVTALCTPRPWFARAADQPPGAGVRPFESLADLRRAAEVLAVLALRIAVAERLGIVLTDGPRAEDRPPLDAYARTALARLRLPPVYKVVAELGPDHAKRFVVEVWIGAELYARAEGASKKAADQNAAAAAAFKLEGQTPAG